LAHQHEHTRARQQVLEILYQSEVTGQSVADILADGNVVAETGPLDEWGMKLALGVEEHKDVLDKRISGISENWSLSRMSIVDRNILRIAQYEMLFDEAVPMGVAINEAVELAKIFGQDESSKFVNGILGEAARLEEGEGAPAKDGDGGEGTTEGEGEHEPDDE
jgi:N utilization substance protein B